MTDDDLAVHQFRPFEQLHRHIKGIHIHVEDGAVLGGIGHAFNSRDVR